MRPKKKMPTNVVDLFVCWLDENDQPETRAGATLT